MAILGFQLVSTLVGASVLSKIVNYMSFARYLLCYKLLRFIHPSSDELCKAANINRNDKNSKKNKKFNGVTQDDNNLNISKSIVVDLKKIPVITRDLTQLHYFSDYQWLLDFSLCCMLVYIANEFVYGCLTESSVRINLSVIWVILGLGFTLRCLISTNTLYFNMTDSADAMIVVMSFFSFLVMAMVVLIVPERHLTFEFTSAYANLTESFAQKFHMKGNSPISLVTIKGVLVVVSAFIGGILTHSGLRYGKMYIDSVSRSTSSLSSIFLHLNFIAPLIIMSFWLTPIQSVILSTKLGPHQINLQDYHTLRLYSLIGFFLLRLLLTRVHLQSYLNLAEERVLSLRKEAGKITIVDFQKIIARIFYCLCLVAIQYLAPVLLCLYITCLYKSLSGLSWLGSFKLPFDPPFNTNSTQPGSNFSLADQILPFMGDLNESAQKWSVSIVEFRAVFTTVFYRSIVGYLQWFTLAALQCTSLLGLVYHRNLVS